MTLRSILTVCVVLVSLTSIVHADSWAPPRPRVYANTWGTHGLKIVPEKGAFGGPTAAVLFTLDETGKETAVWEGKLVNLPHRVWINDTGKSLVTVDTYGSLGSKHALVIYDAKGKAIGDFALEDLLTKDEIAEKVLRTASSRHWAGETKFSFSDDGKHFVIALKWGRTIKVELDTGKIAK